MLYRKVLLGVLIIFGAFNSQSIIAFQAPVRPQAGLPQAGAVYPGAAQVTSPRAHPGKKEPSEEKEITPVKKELIAALGDRKESSLHCTEGGKNHTVTATIIEKKTTKVKRKQGDYVITLFSGAQVTCSKAASK